MLSAVYNGRFLIINRNGKIVKDSYDIDGGKYVLSEEVIKCFEGEDTSYYDQKNAYIEQTIPLKDTLTGNIEGVMLVSTSTGEISDSIDMLQRQGIFCWSVSL